jgi:pimeloyl-ACP methyl ester carboxylesterase
VDELLVDNGDITLRVEVSGNGPTVLCVPGWPELASSWRHQVVHLSDRHGVAVLDVRGYGGSLSVPLPGSDLYADPGSGCTDFRGATIVQAAGHWVHQEAPVETNRALDAFLASL